MTYTLTKGPSSDPAAQSLTANAISLDWFKPGHWATFQLGTPPRLPIASVYSAAKKRSVGAAAWTGQPGRFSNESSTPRAIASTGGHSGGSVAGIGFGGRSSRD